MMINQIKYRMNYFSGSVFSQGTEGIEGKKRRKGVRESVEKRKSNLYNIIVLCNILFLEGS